MFEPISGESIDKLVRQHGFGYRERQVLIDFVKLELRDRTIIPDYVKYLAANARLRTQKVAGTIEEEADTFAAIARAQFIAEKKRELQASSVKDSDADKSHGRANKKPPRRTGEWRENICRK